LAGEAAPEALDSSVDQKKKRRIQMEQVTKNVFCENKVRGCNPGFVVTSEGVVLIDSPVDFAFAQVWAGEIAKRGKILCMINTEHHMDHWLCNGLFGGDIIAHQATRETMLTMDLDFIVKRTKILYTEPLPIPEGYRLKYPNITYQGGMTLYFGNHTFHLIHTPGHTPGLTAVYIPEEKVVFTGDNVVGQTRTAYHDALPEKWLESLKVLESLDARIVLPGHGQAVDKAYLKQQAAIVRGWWEGTQKAKTTGIPFEDEDKRKIDPFFDFRDTGIKPTVTLTATSLR
jgi:cyclase